MTDNSNRSLLQKALEEEQKGGKVQRAITPEHIELALAWVNGQIGIGAMSKAMNLGSTVAAYSMLCQCLKKYILEKELK